VLKLVNLQLASYPARAECLSHTPYQYCSGKAGRSGHHVQEPMHSVAQVDIPVAWRPEHHAVARRLAPVGMTGLVFRANVGLDLRNGQLHHFLAEGAT